PCHGPDAGRRKAGLRLDRSESARTVIEPGKPDAGELVDRITRKGAGTMPPPKTGKKLSAADIAVIRDWIAGGAIYQKHWAYTTPLRGRVPEVKNPKWAKNSIDRFLLAKLEEAGRSPAARADRVTLARRLHLDLLGLPPSPGAVDDFVSD